jgi:hypothetical protein
VKVANFIKSANTTGGVVGDTWGLQRVPVVANFCVILRYCIDSSLHSSMTSGTASSGTLLLVAVYFVLYPVIEWSYILPSLVRCLIRDLRSEDDLLPEVDLLLEVKRYLRRKDSMFSFKYSHTSVHSPDAIAWPNHLAFAVCLEII